MTPSPSSGSGATRSTIPGSFADMLPSIPVAGPGRVALPRVVRGVVVVAAAHVAGVATFTVVLLRHAPSPRPQQIGPKVPWSNKKEKHVQNISKSKWNNLGDKIGQ